MAIGDSWASLQPYFEKLAVWEGYEPALQSLLIYGAGIALFTTLVFAFFCENLSRRDAFLSPDHKTARARLLRLAEFGLVFPAVSFLFFGVLAASLFLLGKSQTTEQILLLSMAIVVGVRMTAFIAERSASDLAKLLPLSLLGVLLVDPSYASLERSWAHVTSLPSLFPLLWRCAVLFVVLEGVMRLGYMTVHRLFHRKAKAKKRAVEYDGDPHIGITTPVRRQL